MASKKATSKKTNSRSAKTTPVAGTARSNNGFSRAAARSEKDQAAKREVVSGAFLAAAFGVAKRTVQSWKKNYGMPAMVAKDKYDIAEVVAWFVRWKLSEVVVGNGDEKRLLKAQADERAEKAKQAEMNTQQRKGELIDAGTVRHERIQRIVAVKTALEYLAIILSEKLIGVKDKQQVRMIVGGEVYKCLENFADGREIEQVKKKKIKKKKIKSLTTKGTKHTKHSKL